ncbi:hypothetical protein L917_02097 [Phytophthora nicotianae]|uniref:Uncharacterized protein n=1 Tax=Phytophthora nicotianae TaxID=4792 RepID=W2LV17_PHYNI|nr:hypothetical protein L917_02097 [Phytophthora nicotianae]
MTSRKRAGMAGGAEETSTAIVRERDGGNNLQGRAATDEEREPDKMTRMLTLMKCFEAWFKQLEESQAKSSRVSGDGDRRARNVHHPMTPPMDSILFASDFRRGARMHLASLAGSRQPGNGLLVFELQRLYTAAQASPARGPAGPAPLPPRDIVWGRTISGSGA